MNAVGAARERVLGWDALRGACAIAVAAYHLAGWLDLAHWPVAGTYGVYLFFVLSGASLAYNHPAAQFRSGTDIGRFLAQRWLRLAPLHLGVCVVFLAMLAAHHGAWADRIALRLALNATFAFGLHDPVVWALAIGGWSLGIEFVFYLAFPWLVRAAEARGPLLVVGALLLVLQFGWIAQTLGRQGWAEAVVSYHQVPAFGAWFFTGCVIGARRRVAHVAWQGSSVLAAVACFTLLSIAVGPLPIGEAITGWHGPLLFAAGVVLVLAAGRARVPARVVPWARRLGDATYGTYLLHPVLFFGVAWFLAGGPLEASATPVRCAILAAVLGAALLLGAASERWFEAPLRRRLGAALRGPRVSKPGPQSEAASISS